MERMVSARQPHKEMMTTTSALYLHLGPQEEIEQRVWALEPHLDLPLRVRPQTDTGHTASAPHPHVVKEDTVQRSTLIFILKQRRLWFICSLILMLRSAWS